jgi:CxxC-x17-CxxC domain-containing protein
MAASVGDFVSPGSKIEIPQDSVLGVGLYDGPNGVVASFSGILISNDGGISVKSNRPMVNVPDIGDIFIGQVNRLNPKTAEIKILHVENKESGNRDVPALKQFADIYITELVDRFIPAAGDTMRVRDIIRARIIDNDPILKASTKGDNRLGVLHAICPACGCDLVTSDTTPDFNVSCTRCDYRGYRILSTDFGYGFTSMPDDKISALNRAGERWSSAAESMLGHDGARPYLSPMADFRRGTIHKIPEKAKRSSNSSGSGNRQNRTMHSTKCTLCDVKTQVPFSPTPGKPIRCRDCMSKVKDGKASKEELANERKILMEARSKAAESEGMKLFVASLSYDVTEDELREVFSTYGNLKDLHIAVDKETGKSKGFAFVTFSNPKEGKKAISELKNKELNGRKMSVQESNRDSKRNNKNHNRR